MAKKGKFKNIYIIKSNGERDVFSPKKVFDSIRRSGASVELAEEIVRDVENNLYPEITTKEIFREVKRQLHFKSPGVAIAFNLKEGIRKLGPTGFPFEKYIGGIFTRSGYKVKLNQYVSGVCCKNYEIDFLAEKDNLLYVGECKYHNLAGGRIHRDIALANYARFLDIKNNVFKKRRKIKSLLVTNTKLTPEAIQYSECVGVYLLGWKYPRQEGLEKIIEKGKFYPITILPSLKSYLADIFVSNNIMLARDILEIDLSMLVKKSNIIKQDIERLKREAELLLGRN